MAADGGSGPSHGHFFVKKTFHKPTYCHHCTEVLWGLIQQGYVCEVCNFIVHDRCMKTVVNHCSSIAAQLVKTPVSHCWSDQLHFKRKFCNVCRKRLDDTWAVRCEICDYHVHADCQDLAVANCKSCSEYIPERKLSEVVHTHHWLEGNLPINTKCVICKRSCYSTECLAGLRCQWCGLNAHSSCWYRIPSECNYGLVEPIMLPPQAVSVPRTEVPMEAILGIQPRRKDTISPRSISEDFTSDHMRYRDEDGCTSKEKSKDKQEDREEEIIKVYDGNWSLRRRLFRTISISKNANVEQFLGACLKANHIHRKPNCYYLTDASETDERPLTDPNPVAQITKKEGKRPAVFLRFRDSNDSGTITIYPSQLNQVTDPITLTVTSQTLVRDSIREAITSFNLLDQNVDMYQLSEIILDKGVVERVMTEDERPWELLKSASRDSIRQMELTRFYLQHRDDPHGSTIALYVANLPLNFKQRQYENILTELLGEDNKFQSIGPIYYEYGSMVITYLSSTKAVKAFYTLREASFEDKSLLVLLLPTIVPQMCQPKVRPLLVFVNVKSGGCQGLELIGSFRKLLNPYQVYDLDNGGPLPGLWVFRHVRDYRILVCGGDGTIGWVLQCLDNVGQDSECSSPPCAIVPLGTGNDLARVLHWGPGYTGGEDPLSLLRDIIDAEEIRLDRWTVVFHTEEKVQEERPIPCATAAQLPPGTTNEDNTQIFVMNNYFGIGIDADLCLDFHNAREENPNKFNSRLHNKGVYVKMGIRKMMSRKLCKDLHRVIRLEVDGKHVELPPTEGIIILNILSWGSGANPWGPEKEDNFNKPNHWDGMLEVMGVTGVVHLGQIQSGLRSAIRIAQGAHIRIKLFHEVPVQVDGEPWIQSPGEVVVLKSALKATMLKKMKNKMRRRNTEPTMTGGMPHGLSLVPDNNEATAF